MKKVFLSVIISICALSLFAQPYDTHNQRLSFLYIAHDENMSVYDLIERLRSCYDDAINAPEEEAAVFYLPNGSHPIVAKVNTADSNQEEFFTIIEELQSKRFHDVEPSVDIETIMKIFNENDIIDEAWEYTYDEVEWIYYINSTFWGLNNNENVIAALYWGLDMDKLINDRYLRVQIFHSRQDTIKYNNESPFGTKNICDGMKFFLMPF